MLEFEIDKRANFFDLNIRGVQNFLKILEITPSTAVKFSCREANKNA